MIKTVIIEDEKPDARKLERMLGLFTDLEVVANLDSVEAAVQWFAENENPQLIFSDIVLGDGLSFDIFDKISTKAFIIYTTAFDQYTLKAFKLNSIDYLLKLSRILVKIGYNLKIVQTHEVSCFFSENKIVYLQTQERTYPSDFTLDELEDVLDEKKFFRVNRQFIINSDYIKNIHTSPNYKVELEFQPQEEITVSRDRVKDFKDWLVS